MEPLKIEDLLKLNKKNYLTIKQNNIEQINILKNNMDLLLIKDVYELLNKNIKDLDIRYININTQHEYNDEGLTYYSSVMFDDEDYETGIYGIYEDDDLENKDKIAILNNLRVEIDKIVYEYKPNVNNNISLDINKLKSIFEKNNIEKALNKNNKITKKSIVKKI